MCIGYWHHELRGKGVASGKVILMERSENINSPFISGLRENVNTLRMQSRRKKNCHHSRITTTHHTQSHFIHFVCIFVEFLSHRVVQIAGRQIQPGGMSWQASFWYFLQLRFREYHLSQPVWLFKLNACDTFCENTHTHYFRSNEKRTHTAYTKSTTNKTLWTNPFRYCFPVVLLKAAAIWKHLFWWWIKTITSHNITKARSSLAQWSLLTLCESRQKLFVSVVAWACPCVRVCASS